jgi:hypothetical protein
MQPAVVGIVAVSMYVCCLTSRFREAKDSCREYN